MNNIYVDIGIYESLKELDFDSAIRNRYNALRPEEYVAGNKIILWIYSVFIYVDSQHYFNYY